MIVKQGKKVKRLKNRPDMGPNKGADENITTECRLQGQAMMRVRKVKWPRTLRTPKAKYERGKSK